jgi:hypothetical protein
VRLSQIAHVSHDGIDEMYVLSGCIGASKEKRGSQGSEAMHILVM